MGFLDEALVGERPFFLAVTPIAPHSNMNGTFGGGQGPLWMDEPIPEERHKHLFPDAKVPRNANFNPRNPTGVSWIHDQPYRNQSVIYYNDHYYRQRLRALQSVDELDNGFHISQHRLPPGKTCGFEEDIRVPFMIRGPGIPQNFIEKSVTTHVDIAPTIFQLAGIELRTDFDGTPMATVPNNTYKASDPYQVNNLWKKNHQEVKIFGHSMSKVISRLNTLLMVLKSCRGFQCIKPWDTLHPDGSVTSLMDALDSKYDTFYESQPNVSFGRCAYGYEIEAEGPQNAKIYRNGYNLEEWI
ncbi:hypothetical protein PENSTE_c002G00438 [Penicillium steckii]|uniref:Sulfatase N-terminal domain-containing protein n=1 Tax=Penicillium steckii TaxID=303698 RepID=A0A1V6TTS7_9EURO|nr:hypothetical protein PENSTE_c002G00438 [Penicillium steckii]